MKGPDAPSSDESDSTVDICSHPSTAKLLPPACGDGGGGGGGDSHCPTARPPIRHRLKSESDAARSPSTLVEIRAERNHPESPLDKALVYPDGGWGWFCVVGSFIATFILGGVEKSFGLIFGEIEDKFHASALATSWVGSLSTTCRLTLGFLGGLLSAKYSCRVVTVAGGLLYGLGVTLSSFSPNISYLYVFYGFLPGLGGSLIYVSSTLIVNEYFDKRRGVANGIASAGSGMGALCMPLLIQWLLENYGLFGETLIVGATVLHICVSGALYRPLRRAASSTSTLTDSSAPSVSAENAVLHSWSSLNRALSRWWKELLHHMRVLRNPRFSLFCSSIILLYMSYLPSVYFLPALAEAAAISKSSAALLLSIVGACDMCGRILSGFLFDVKQVKPYRAYIYNTAFLWLALAGISQTLSSQYYQFCICSAVHGFFNGICVAQRSVIVTDVVGNDAVNQAVGILITCQGLGVAAGPSVTGLLVDTQRNYKAPFYFCAATQLVAGALFAANLLVQRRQRAQRRPCFVLEQTTPLPSSIGTDELDEQRNSTARPRSASHVTMAASMQFLRPLSPTIAQRKDIFSSFNFEDDLYACYLSRQSLATAVTATGRDTRGGRDTPEPDR